MESITATVLNNFIPIIPSKDGTKNSKNERIMVTMVLNLADKKLTKNERLHNNIQRTINKNTKNVKTLHWNGI